MTAPRLRALAILCLCSAMLPCSGQNQPQLQTAGSNPALARLPGTEAYRRFALLHEGDSFRGKALFADDQKVGCSKCHTVDGTAAKAGPDLFAVGDKFGRRDIIESVLAPSAIIAAGYSATTIETKSGDEYTGIIKQVADTWIELMGADAKRLRIPVADITERRTSEVSLMPEGLQTGLTVPEFTDLIEYLVSLKQPQSAVQVEHGMPDTIQELGRPITLRPLIPEDLKFEHLTWFGPIPGQPDAFLVVEHETGKIWRLEKGRDSRFAKTLFVDLGRCQTGTHGLLGLALHPSFRRNRKYYLANNIVENGKYVTVIGEREAASDFKTDSGRPARVVLSLDAGVNVDYAGSLEFGPDGFLYIGMGDTGPLEDPLGHGQNTRLFLGKMLRIDVDHRNADLPYAIPPNNPFVGRADFRPEIWAYGLREPWRFSFDLRTGDLWVGDVGQDRYEEVDIVRRGENYGWNVYEGFEPFSNRYRRAGETYVPPVFAYGRKYGVCVAGGFVYRANRRSSFYGVYIFADYQSQRLFGLMQTHRVLNTIRQIGMAPQRVVSFGRDARGELYVVGYDGMIYQLDFHEAVFR
ncbi:MAG: PQQ-dependent sugar dehydrogenase [Limisphaerales bacterium]